MNIIIHPHPLKGSVHVPCSKSFAHRILIAAALADQPTQVEINALNADIAATIECLRALGAQIDQENSIFTIHPVNRSLLPEKPTLFCGESGSTLRFMIPVAAALEANATMTGTGRLPERPNAVLTEALNAHGAQCDNDLLPMKITGRLCRGIFEIAGNVSSQYITGLLFALPLCAGDSEIRLTTRLESSAYIDITLAVLHAFGITIQSTENGWIVPGNQTYKSPGRFAAEGDWSGAAFLLAANSLGSEVECIGLNPESVQGDRAVTTMLNRLGTCIDVSDTPDLVPALAVAAALHPGITCITGAARLRLKESDRLVSVSDMLTALGADVEIFEDGLLIRGKPTLSGGTVNGCNDHRIVMAAAIAATAASGPVVITDAQAVAKSYPAFFEDFTALGGIAHVQSDR